MNNRPRYTRRRRTAIEYGKSAVQMSWYHNYIKTFLNDISWPAPAKYIPVKYEDVCKPVDYTEVNRLIDDSIRVMSGLPPLTPTWRKRMGLE